MIVKWKNNGFAYPFNLLRQLSGFPNLYVLCGILCGLPVSSASAERTISKLRIIKNRLRSSLSDDTMSPLMIMAAESDLLQNISNADIINRMAITSPSLCSRQLL